MPADDLVTPGARASAAMVLIYFLPKSLALLIKQLNM